MLSVFFVFKINTQKKMSNEIARRIGCGRHGYVVRESLNRVRKIYHNPTHANEYDAQLLLYKFYKKQKGALHIPRPLEKHSDGLSMEYVNIAQAQGIDAHKTKRICSDMAAIMSYLHYTLGFSGYDMETVLSTNGRLYLLDFSTLLKFTTINAAKAITQWNPQHRHSFAEKYLQSTPHKVRERAAKVLVVAFGNRRYVLELVRDLCVGTAPAKRAICLLNAMNSTPQPRRL
jgi:hypothetical protein